MEPILKNVIATCQLQTPEPIDLTEISSKVQGSEYNKKRFAGIIMRKIKPKGTILLFRSKKVMIVGCLSIEDSESLSRKIAKDLKKVMNCNVNIQNFRIVNLVANAQVNYSINMKELMNEKYALKDQKFPGVYIQLEDIKSALIFENGKIILNGARTEENLAKAYRKLCSILQKYVKNREKKEAIQISPVKIDEEET